MKLTQVIDQLLHKKSKPANVLLSLLIDLDYVGGAVWITGDKAPLILGTDLKLTEGDGWEQKFAAADEVISNLEEHKLHEEDVVKNVVLGLPPAYLTDTGDIQKEIRGEIKTLTERFELDALGYVSVLQALAFALKKEEGVPTNAIFIGVAGQSVSLSVYKSGVCIKQSQVKLSELLVGDIEKELNDIADVEVLPSRMLLWGGDKDSLESVKGRLLQHPWTTRIKVLHFPKIEILSTSQIMSSISYAGANELATAIASEEVITAGKPDKSGDETDVEDIEELDATSANVVEVDPESLGFVDSKMSHPTEIEAKTVVEVDEEDIDEKDIPISESPVKKVFQFPQLRLPSLSFSLKNAPLKWLGVGLTVVLIIGVLLWFSTVVLAQATVILYVLPERVSAEQNFNIDTEATTLGISRGVIPGKKISKSVTVEKTVPATGKKRVGDPAQGEVVLYNKAVTSKSLKKGTILEKGSLKFSLNEEVLVASASESVGSITFGKTPAKVTAQAIGVEGNLPAGTEFTVQGLSENVMIGRSEKAFTGGTSRDIQVVSRVDYDALLKAATTSIIEQAKEELAQSVGSEETLVEQTIETVVTGKKYTQELDAEEKEVSGSITLTISGVTFVKSEVEKALMDIAGSGMPPGYKYSEAKTDINIGQVSVKKDGTLSVLAKLTAQALPEFDEGKLQQDLAGVTLEKMQSVVRQVPGIAAVDVKLKNTWDKSKLPARKENIRIQVSLQ